MNKIITIIAVLLSSICFSQVPNYIPTNGLVAYYPFNGNTNDESGNGLNGFASGASLDFDRYGIPNSSYKLSNYNQYINFFGDGSWCSSSHTISFWINTICSDRNQFILSKRETCAGGDENYFEVRVKPNVNQLDIGWGGSAYFYNIPFNAGEWNNIIYTINGSMAYVYVNGILIDSETYISRNNNVMLKAGNNLCSAYNMNGYYAGRFDDLCIWDRGLTQFEINYLSQSCEHLNFINPISQQFNLNDTILLISTVDNVNVYQWQTNLGFGFQNLSNFGQYSGVNDDTLLISQLSQSNNNQAFRCIAIDGICSDTSSTAILTLYDETGISETKLNTIIVYPNPSSERVFINTGKYSMLNKGSYTIRIVNTLSQNLYQSAINQQLVDVNIIGLSPGLYSIQIVNRSNIIEEYISLIVK